jgi:hypothetical protein
MKLLFGLLHWLRENDMPVD